LVFYKAGGFAALALFVYALVTMVVLVTLGGAPATAQEAFTILEKNRLVGLLRLDVLTLAFMPAYYVLFAGLFVALEKTNRIHTAIAAALAFIGVTLFLSAPSVTPLLHLSQQYSAATNEARKAMLLAAGEAAIASDMWHSSGAIIGGILLQAGCVWISAVMLDGRVFSKTTAYIGLVMYALDLAHGLIGLLSTSAGAILMMIAGPLYLVWFPLVARKLFQLSRTNKPNCNKLVVTA
jgi:hypothetical protein